MTSEVQLARQSLRRLGFAEIVRQVTLQFPKYDRKAQRSLARYLHREAWRDRDKEAVAKVIAE